MSALFILLVGCGSKKEAELKMVSLDDVKARIANKEDFIFVVGRDTCTACQAYKPVVKEMIKNKNVDMSYLQIIEASWSQAQIDNLKLYVEKELGQVLNATPTTYYVNKGVVTGTNTGALQYKQLLDELVDRGFVKK